MDVFSLDIRTLNFITVLFSIIYCIGLLLFQVAQQPITGLSLFSFSIFVIGSGPLLLSFRGVTPDYLSVIVANMLIALGFHLTLYSISLFRDYSLRLAYCSAWMLLLVLAGFIYFTYVEPSIKCRVVVVSVYLAFVTISTAVAVIRGRNQDLSLAKHMMGVTFLAYGLFMLLRALLTALGEEINSFMSANLLHQLTFLFSIVLIVSMSFSMLWLINARLVSSIHKLSYLDPLTQLQNRRALDAAIPQIRQQVSHAPVCMLLLDIDNFKSINDQYGHLIGDDVLKLVSNTLRRVLPASAGAFRLGGDEILVILTDNNLQQAQEFAESLRQTISQLTLLEYPDFHVTSSVGIAQLAANENWKMCVERADKALYRAKKSGRNRVSV
ncbi:diguanylate cyclase domain-containing protein [Motilimonas sp. KMU-193]|uniref:GGDEF domain-containing protein n=1 Tax=Motilimonas sp. KMU-193 TaxID=3388668 RepID=UPI00396B07A0